MLTAQQHKTFKVIKRYIKEHGYAPTVAEIAQEIGIKSRGVVHRYVSAIEENGLITKLPNRRRNIELVNTASNTGIPLLGKIAAGQPIEAVSRNESIDVTDMFLGPNRYALKVQGDSMVEEGILDNDIVVCERTEHAANGQIVVALIDGEEATLKRLKTDGSDDITLLPANANYRPMVYPANRVKIQGIFIGLLRFVTQ